MTASDVALRDPGPMARLEGMKGDATVVSEIFHRLTDDEEPMTLTEIAKAWKVPKGRFIEWYTTEHAQSYEAALRVLGGEIGHAVKKLVDAVTPETLGVLKFKTDRYLRLAGHWDPQRYAPKQGERGISVVPVLVIEIAGGQIAGGAAVEPRVIEAETIEVVDA